MKKSILSPTSPPLHKTLFEKDKREIYGTDPHDYYAAQYRQRIKRIVELVRSKNPARVAEFGSAQGNISLMLAESGLKVIAVDISPLMLSFCRLKLESGTLSTINATASRPPLKPGSCDCIILGEIIEHCSNPLSMLRPAFDLLRKNGTIIITTPNQESSNNTLPTYTRFIADNPRLKSDSFGPDGDAHLFAFTQKELNEYIAQAGLIIEYSTSMGNHFMQWKMLYHLRHAVPWLWNNVFEAIIPHLPVIGQRTTNTLFCVAKKGADV